MTLKAHRLSTMLTFQKAGNHMASTMAHSAETRWFFPLALSSALEHWFTAQGLVSREPTREDEYLIFPGCDSVGVKLREGKLEIKALVSASRPLMLDAGINGRMDSWVKWSFDSTMLHQLDTVLHESSHWLKVRKTRLLRKFSGDSGYLVEVDATQPLFPLMGCNVELTSIEVEGDAQPWLTLGFEGFGPLSMIHKMLIDTIQMFFQKQGMVPGLTLSGRISSSYPSWLAALP
jgi:hypothetical protein